ncbi:MAG: glycine--tRNA ligase [Bacteroidetes bacterium]|jgi:glycyl-tRNA synthetase|nr:glycine--tRNA ligase [Bacteroidota bacterium]
MEYSEVFQKLLSHCKEHGFVFQSSEIYENGLPAVYDYGPLGVLMKNNLKNLWWKSMVQLHENIVGLDAAILMHPQVWKASGHVDAFNDPLIDNKDSKKRYRADQLVEEWIHKRREKARKEADKKAQKEGWTAGDESYNHFLAQGRDGQKAAEAEARLSQLLAANDLAGLKGLIEELEIACELSGSKNWTEVRQFNLMFKTQLGSTADAAMDLYLRPETAQGIFVNFLNVQKTSRQKLPFGIAQMGKAFRNEIVARQFIFRMREFEQLEMQFFVKPGTQAEHFAYWREARLRWHQQLGIPAGRLRLHTHEKLAHYADAAVDIEFEFPFGFKELEGIHSRTDFDLSRHQELSGKKLQYFDPEENRSYTPYVVETSLGLDRLFLAHLSQAYREEEVPTAKGDTELRTVLRLHPLVAPIQVAILPLLKKDGLPELAREIMADLQWQLQLEYDEKDAIGRRYRRQDAKGTPFCVTIDHDSLQDEAVTVRERDSMRQERIPIQLLRNHLMSAFSLKRALVG